MTTKPTSPRNSESTTTAEPTTNGQVKSSRYNIDKMREAARQYSVEGGFQGKEDLITVPVYCPPPSSEFIRVRDDDGYWIECMTLDYAPENGRRETYFIATELMNLLPPEIQSEVKWSRLYTAIIRRGNVTFLWRIKVYDSGPGGLSTKTALVCAEKAKRLWTRVSWQDRKGYAPYEAPGDFGEPQWTEHTFEELLDKAFQDTYIDSLEHPAIRDLMGWDV
jgi:hypothetical protein